MMRTVTAFASNLDGRRFALVSSTASDVDATDPTIFDYHERHGMIWGEYGGDTVRIGRFVGSREGDRIAIRFTHVLDATGEVVGGAAQSRIAHRDGKTLLIETFETATGTQESICTEVDRTPEQTSARTAAQTPAQ